MAFKYTSLNSIVGSAQFASAGHVLDLEKRILHRPGSIAHIFTTLATSTLNITKTDTYKVFVLGAGGAGTNQGTNSGGDGGFFSAEIPLNAGDTLEIGVGQGGVWNGNSAQSTSSYVMRGGPGRTSHNGSWHGGDGGGGSYIKISSGASATQPNYQDYVIIAGGGGGAGNHSHTANYGGYGFGVGGGAYNAEWGGRTSSSSATGGAGYNGYDGSGGGGGYPRSTVNAWNYGGGSNNLNQYHGGEGGGPLLTTTADYVGGGGGGGAGGGGGSGSGGVDTANIGGAAVDGGYLSTTTTVNGFTADIIPRGGGGGGGHTNDCAATGGGGGALLFTAYNTSWGPTMGVHIPYHNTQTRNTDTQLNAISQYTAYAELAAYSNTYFGYDMTTTAPASGGIQGLGYAGGTGGTNGINGCVIIANLNTSLTPTIL